MTMLISPEDLTAEDRRQSWFQRELTGYGDIDWDYGDELLEILAARFRVIEVILGKEEASPHLFAMLPGPDIEGATWEEAFDSYLPSISLHWPGAKLLDNAGIYGLYGVTPADIPAGEREAWVDTLASELERFRELVQPDPPRVIARIVNLALGRHGMDRGEGDVDLASLAVFGGVTEGRIRNILSSDSILEKVGQRVTAASAAAWLRGRKEFFASIWQQPDQAPPEPPSSDYSDDVIFVPVAADGSHFHPGLERGGGYMIGAKGEETQYARFEDALAALQRMATPRWRRPNEVGNWGIVSGRDWKRIERRNLLPL